MYIFFKIKQIHVLMDMYITHINLYNILMEGFAFHACMSFPTLSTLKVLMMPFLRWAHACRQ